MAFMPYLHFQGNCAEAMAFYADLFGASDLQLMRYSDAPPGSGPSFASDLVMHSQFTAGGAVLMASDFPPGWGEAQKAVSVMIDPATVPEAQARFDRLVAGGEVVMPFGPTFWSPGFGMVKDRFGTHWIIGAQPETPGGST